MNAPVAGGLPRPHKLSCIASRLRASPLLSWFGKPVAYAACAPLLSVLGAGTMLVAPRLLNPASFGQFALLNSVFQFAGRGDLGLSQMCDRDLAARRGEHDPGRGDVLLRAHAVVGTALFALLAPLLASLSWATGALSPLDVVLALAAGLSGMAANGLVSVMRARGRIREFTLAALALQSGLTLPRLAGLVAAGVTGCFTAMAAWFVAFAAVLVAPAARRAPRVPVLPLLRESLPMFAFAWLWMTYTMANRWVSASLSDGHDFGLFAFGANLTLTAVGILATVGQVRYPTLLACVSAREPGGCGALFEREAGLLAGGLALLGAVAIPAVPPTVAALFPAYVDACVTTMVLGVTCVPLGVGAWFLPVVVALSPSPARDALRTIGVPLAVLAGGMVAGNAVSGIEGQAWGCVAGGLAMAASLALTLLRLGVVGRVRAARIAALPAACVAGLALLVLWTHPTRAGTQAGPPAGWVTAFEDRFETLRLWDRSGGTWQPTYAWGARTNVPNKELEYYVDPRPGRDPDALRAYDPFRTGPGGLVITARPLAARDRPLAQGLAYASGLLSTAQSFSFTYGYAEMEAQVPRGRGTWPAFWLLPSTRTWPPEIDVMEVLGHETDGYYATVHYGTADAPRHAQRKVAAAGLADGYHAYGVKWSATEITWYLDGREVFSAPTPPDMHGPMYLLVNLAMGGTWPGPPDASTPFPAELKVRRIRVLVPPKPATTAKGN